MTLTRIIGFKSRGSEDTAIRITKKTPVLTIHCHLRPLATKPYEYPHESIESQGLRFGEFLADNIVRFINLFTYLLTYLLSSSKIPRRVPKYA